MHISVLSLSAQREHLEDTFFQAAQVANLSSPASRVIANRCIDASLAMSLDGFPFGRNDGYYVSEDWDSTRTFSDEVLQDYLIRQGCFLSIHAGVFYHSLWFRHDKKAARNTPQTVSLSSKMFRQAGAEFTDKVYIEIGEKLAGFVLALREHPRNLGWRKFNAIEFTQYDKDAYWLSQHSGLRVEEVRDQYTTSSSGYRLA